MAVAHDEGTGVSLKRNMAKRSVENQESIKWGTQVVKHEGQIFFGRLMKEGSIFTRVFRKRHFVTKKKSAPHHATGGYLGRTYPEGGPKKTSVGGPY